jgi:AraC family transcriptional regulator of adaptative response / DNA-3-methyladenine glycosylase II
VIEDPERCYRAASSRDPRFDGWFIVAVTSTGVYCRPSCPARKAKRQNVRFYPTAAAAQAGGFRACKRCRPDAAPGSPEWNVRGDVVARAMRMVADGVVDREGVTGLARRLGYSARHLDRLLVAEVGAGPLALARAQRAQTARVLIETTDLPFGEAAFGAGFGSLRQFNDTVRAVFAATPTELRRARRGTPAPDAGSLTLRLARREPFAGRELFAFLALRAVPGIEEATDGAYARTLDLPGGPGTIRVSDAGTHLDATLRLQDWRDLQLAVARARRVFDLDADPVAVDEVLERDDALGPLIRKRPGLRVPATTAGHELATRAVIGQQISVAGARTVTARLVQALGEPLPEPVGELTHVFPTADALAAVDPASFPMPRSRGRALARLAAAIDSGEVDLDTGADRDRARAGLLAVEGIGPWTADYVAMRALGDPDVFLAGDLGARHALGALGLPADVRAAAAHASRWAPWRSYATLHLWSSLR